MPDGGNGHSAYDLDSFTALVREVPPESIRYHQSRGDLARWLREAVGNGEVAAQVEDLDDPGGIAERLDEVGEVLWNRLSQDSSAGSRSTRCGSAGSPTRPLTWPEALARDHEVHYFTRGDFPNREVAGVTYHYCQPAGENIVDYCQAMSRQMVEGFRKVGGDFDYLHFHDWHTVETLRALKDQNTIFSFHSTEFGRHGNTMGTEQISGTSRRPSGPARTSLDR